MLKKVITYTDYDGEERKETFWFNLSRTELVDIDMDHKGGFKSEDGKRFIKSQQLTDEFIQSPAYDELFFELLSGGADAMAEFVNSIISIPNKKSALEVLK